MSLSKLTKEWVVGRLPKRPKDANKGTFGKVLVIAGSEKFPGSAYLSCAACYRVGAGLVTLATAELVKIIVSRKLPEVTFLAPDEILEKIKDYNVLLLGPGLGQSAASVKLVEELMGQQLPKTVIDGDGLNILSKIEKWWNKLRGEIVLTPHPGEMARLTGLSISHIQTNRQDIAIKFARIWNKTLVLKGASSVIVSPSGELKVSPFANPVLATAGTGDVLAGVIAGLGAQGLDVFDSSSLGVYIHGLAGELLSKKIGNTGVLASDLLVLLPQVIKSLKH